MAHAAWFMVTASMAIAVFLGLAIHIVTHNPRRPIRWVFGAFLFYNSVPLPEKGSGPLSADLLVGSGAAHAQGIHCRSRL